MPRLSALSNIGRWAWIGPEWIAQGFRLRDGWSGPSEYAWFRRWVDQSSGVLTQRSSTCRCCRRVYLRNRHLVRVRGVFQVFAGVCQDEFSQFDSAQRQHTVRDPLNVLASPLHDDYFQAVVMVEMDVSSREDHCACRMLNLGQLLREIRNMMIVDKRQSADHWFVRFDDLGQKSFPYEIADCLGAIFVSASGNQPVKLMQEIFIERNASATDM